MWANLVMKLLPPNASRVTMIRDLRDFREDVAIVVSKDMRNMSAGASRLSALRINKVGTMNKQVTWSWTRITNPLSCWKQPATMAQFQMTVPTRILKF